MNNAQPKPRRRCQPKETAGCPSWQQKDTRLARSSRKIEAVGGYGEKCKTSSISPAWLFKDPSE